MIPLIRIISRELKYIAFDEDGAKALGLSIRFYRYLFYSLIALAASMLSSTIGVLVTHVIMAVPGALFLRFSKSCESHDHWIPVSQSDQYTS